MEKNGGPRVNKLLKTRVKETSTTTGTGTLDLDGPVTGFQGFVTAFGNGNTCYYTLIHGSAWEQGIGTVISGTPNTLQRTTILNSSNADAALNLGAGTKTISCDVSPVVIGGPEQRILHSPLSRVVPTNFLAISGTAYFVYVGKVEEWTRFAFVELHCTVAGAGAQAAELGLYSSPLPPNKAGQTLSRLVASGTIDSLTTTGVKRNTASFALDVAPGTHLWAAARFAMATTQPSMIGLANDRSEGNILTTTGGGALTGVLSPAGGLVTLSTALTAPDLHVTRD